MLADPSKKYLAYPVVNLPDRQWPGNTLTKVPQWCSSDLRDGNQSLAEPMDNPRKRQFFEMLVRC